MTRSMDFEVARAEALRHPCTYCGAAVDEPCRHKNTGRPLEHFPAHEIRTRGWRPRLVHDQAAEDRRRAQAEAELAAITTVELPFDHELPLPPEPSEQDTDPDEEPF